MTANYFQTLWPAAGSWTPVHRGGRTARSRYPCRDHQLSTLGAPWRRPERARPARAGQRRAVHGGRCRSEGIHRGRASPDQRCGCRLARTRRSARRRAGRAHGRRARGARVERRGAAPSRHLGRDCRAGTRHRWPPARAGVSGRQRRLHARDVGAFASHVHARCPAVARRLRRSPCS